MQRLFLAIILTPGHGQNTNPLVINLWLVQSSYPGDLALFRAWVGANGVAVNGNIINLLHVPAHCLYRGATPGFTDGEIVYCGGGTNYDEDHLLRWYYRARAFDTSGNVSEWSNEVVGRYPTDVPGAQITRLRLYPNHPSPFNPMTRIRFDLPGAGPARLAVSDVAGRLIRTLLDADLPAGSHQAAWGGKDGRGVGVASGSYFDRLTCGRRVETVRMSLIRQDGIRVTNAPERPGRFKVFRR